MTSQIDSKQLSHETRRALARVDDGLDMLEKAIEAFKTASHDPDLIDPRGLYWMVDHLIVDFQEVTDAWKIVSKNCFQTPEIPSSAEVSKLNAAE